MGIISDRARRGPVLLGAVAALTAALTVGGCTSSTPAPQASDPDAAGAEQFARDLQAKISTDAMFVHLQKLQDIAEANGGNRAVGTPGYDASIDYVAGLLREHGFEVSTPEFDVRVSESEPGTVSAGDASFTAHALKFSIGTPADGVSGPLVALRADDDSPGCTEDDYDGVAATGAVVLVNRGKCPFADKLAAAAKRGAAAVVIADTVEQPQMGGTLGAATDVTIPVVSVGKNDGARLREHPGPVTVKVAATVRNIKGRNVIDLLGQLHFVGGVQQGGLADPVEVHPDEVCGRTLHVQIRVTPGCPCIRHLGLLFGSNVAVCPTSRRPREFPRSAAGGPFDLRKRREVLRMR